MKRVGLLGGDGALRSDLAHLLAALPDVELLPGASGTGADVLVVAGDAELGALDRCRIHAHAAPCLLLVEGEPDAERMQQAMAAGARAVLGTPLRAFELGRALDVARAFVPARRVAPGPSAPPGRTAAIVAAAGGSGASTLVHVLAGLLPGPVGVLDLDVADGGLTARLGLEVDPSSAGLAGEESGAAAWERLSVAAPFGRVLPAPPRPDLAWLVRDGLALELLASSRGACAWTLVDVGRALGPALEVPPAVDVVLLVARADALGLAAAARRADFLRRSGVDDGRLLLCLTACPRRRELVLRFAPGPLGRPPDIVLPADPDVAVGGEAGTALRRRGAALVERLRRVETPA